MWRRHRRGYARGPTIGRRAVSSWWERDLSCASTGYGDEEKCPGATARRRRAALQLQSLKRWLISLIVAAAVLTLALMPVLSRWKKIRDAKREAGYTLALDAYSKALRPGMTHKEVEEYLRSANTQFSETLTAYGGRRQSQWADLVKIGESESAVWYCGKEYVYVALEFTPVNQLPRRPEDADVLQRIEMYRVADCL
jgi:hypothetical protein